MLGEAQEFCVANREKFEAYMKDKLNEGSRRTYFREFETAVLRFLLKKAPSSGKEGTQGLSGGVRCCNGRVEHRETGRHASQVGPICSEDEFRVIEHGSCGRFRIE